MALALELLIEFGINETETQVSIKSEIVAQQASKTRKDLKRIH
jgi:hypothetical protein